MDIDTDKAIAYMATFTFSFAYCMVVFWNGVMYLLAGETGFGFYFHRPLITLNQEIVLKGFLFGLTGEFIFKKLKLPGFAPFGWIGGVIALILTGQIFVFVAGLFGFHYDTFFYGRTFNQIVILHIVFLLMIVAGTISCSLLSNIINEIRA